MTAVPWFVQFIAARDGEDSDLPRRRRVAEPLLPLAVSERNERHRALVARIQAGDEGAFAALFREFYLPLCDYVVSMGQSSDAADDIVEELFLKLWTSRAEWAVHGSVSNYLYVAVRHRALNYAVHERSVERRFERAALVNDPPRPADADAALNAADQAIVVQRAVAALPERARLVFLLYYRDGLSYAEIAAQLGIARKTVENQLARALKILSTRLKRRLQ
jgi:RNA polymerase sigma-70 factor (ECF subfamily)